MRAPTGAPGENPFALSSPGARRTLFCRVPLAEASPGPRAQDPMVDVLQLATDIAGTVAFLAGPGLLWLFLYLWAWDDEATARAAGFGRRVFWLLLPVALVGSFANAPFFGWDGSALAINVGGALIPLALSAYLPARALPAKEGARTMGLAIASLALVTALLFGVVVATGGPAHFAGAPGLLGPGRAVGSLPSVPLSTVAVPLAAIAAVLAAVALLPSPRGPEAETGRDPPPDPVRGFLALAVLGIVLTFLSTAAVPGVGIVSAFPEYLVAPCLVGLLAVVLARPLFGVPPAVGIAFGYSTATFGVLVGADVLRQPPLYGGGSAGFLAIGGAGLLDLVYLSGLFAVAVGALAYYAGRRRGVYAVPPSPAGTAASPSRLWRSALLDRERGEAPAALAAALRAVENAVVRARHLSRLGPAPPDDPWRGLGVAPWVTTDHLNLRALAARGGNAPGEAERGLAAAQQLLVLARQVELRPVARVGPRALAFLIDLNIVSVPAVLVLALLAQDLPGGPQSVLASVAFTAGVFGYAAYAFLYFLVSEAWVGTTPGKRLLGLEVRTRELERPGALSLLVRNVPRLIPLTILSQFLAVGILVIVRSGTVAAVGGIVPPGALAGITAILLGVGGALFCGALTVGIMWISPERARFGDVWAGTWVIRSAALPGRSTPPPGATGAVPAPPFG
jgi:uncharacterized membrane protein/uncharacterized RDD family membrane protein YckC